MPLNLKIFSFHKWELIFVFKISVLIVAIAGDPRRSEANLYCGSVRSSSQQFITDFVKEMEGVNSLVDKQGWGIFEYGSNQTLYSLAQCMDDLSHTDCLLCFTEARTKLPRCLPSIAAGIQLDGCFLRWDNYSFYQEAVNSLYDKRVCNSSAASSEDYLKLEFIAKTGMGWRNGLMDVVPFIAMITVEFTDVGLTTLSKAGMSRGMSPFVYVVYYNALGTLFLFPSFMFQRRKLPPLTFSLLCKFFLLGLIGICFGQIVGFFGIRYSSPTLSSTLGNLIPAFTFLLAIFFRMEKLDLRSSSGQAKCLGTLVCISGAFIVTLYKGPPIIIIPSLTPTDSPHNLLLLSSQSDWALGGLLIVLTCLCAALWNIVQAATMKEYPSEMTTVFYYCFFGTIQVAIFSLAAERDPNAWKPKPGIELVAIVYSAIFGSVYRSMVHTWGLHKKGPVYVSMFRPLGIVIAVAMGVSFLGDALHIGSVIGAIVIAFGFYAVMWGKAREEKTIEISGECRFDSTGQRAPLLPKNVLDMEPRSV